MTSEEYIQLYQKYIVGKCTPEEEQKLLEYKDSFRLQDVDAGGRSSEEDKALRKQIYSRIKQTVGTKEVRIIKMSYKYAAAIIVIFTIGILTYSILNKNNQGEETSESVALKPIAVPKIDSATAILTLADGSVIPLDEAADGIITHESSTEIRKTKDGELIYDSSKESIEANAAPHKIFIPKGHQYRLTLADGTKVWLNSASSLTYPSRFTGSERQVELSGEGYFEVAKNEHMPFTVTAGDVKVNVLGTQFNISAYHNDEFIKTTLAEGSVRLANNNQHVILKPGQQGIVEKHTEGIVVKQVNLHHALAWKEGYFLFKDDHIKDVMKQISRWYNVTVEYEGRKVENERFGGIYAKSKKLEELLQGLENTGLVKFKIIESTPTQERRVVVMD